MYKVALFSRFGPSNEGVRMSVSEVEWKWEEREYGMVMPIIPSKCHDTPLKQTRAAFYHALFH